MWRGGIIQYSTGEKEHTHKKNTYQQFMRFEFIHRQRAGARDLNRELPVDTSAIDANKDAVIPHKPVALVRPA